MSDLKERQAAAREKHGNMLRENFVKIDKDKSGYASIDEMWSVFFFEKFPKNFQKKFSEKISRKNFQKKFPETI